MAQAVRAGARVDMGGVSDISYGPMFVTPQVMLPKLLADALKGALSLYTSEYAIVCNEPTSDLPMPIGVGKCYSNNRELKLLWRFGNEHNLGWIAIGLSMGFGGLALYAVWHLRTRVRIKGLNALKVVDAFKLGVATADVDVEDGDRALYVRNGWVLPTPTAR